MDSVVFHTTVELAPTVPRPLPVATTAPEELSTTVTVTAKGAAVVPLLETSTNGQTDESAVGVPSAAHLQVELMMILTERDGVEGSEQRDHHMSCYLLEQLQIEACRGLTARSDDVILRRSNARQQ